jgi:hypothetical protein
MTKQHLKHLKNDAVEDVTAKRIPVRYASQEIRRAETD